MPDVELTDGLPDVQTQITDPTLSQALEQANPEDTLMQELRGLFGGIPEDATRETFQSYITQLQQQAEEAARYQQQAEQYERLLAQNVQAANQQQPAPQQQAAAQQQAERRYKAAQQVDPALQAYLTGSFVTQNEIGQYVPIVDRERGINYSLDPNVTRACSQMNAGLQEQRRLLDDFTRDPYDVGNELVTNSAAWKAQQEKLAATEAQIAELKKMLDERLQPIQQSYEEQRIASLLHQNIGWLASEDPTQPSGYRYTVAGQSYVRAVTPKSEGGFGLTPEEAIEFVKPLANARMPEQPKPRPQNNGINRLIANPHLQRAGNVRPQELPVRQSQSIMNGRPSFDDLHRMVFAPEQN